ncbi:MULTISPECIES: response regulator transcription factor [Clostridium]|jgi:two-component system, NarL family, response regulator DegU|uniref:Transcriptional regulatory protein DegU n=2 Tax=root TaxID=1 RepID=A0A644WY67_9ZZZZ|nr:response regulator transcription factor [Clostridium sp. C8]KLE15131.1 regulator [Clostridium sp. C8]
MIDNKISVMVVDDHDLIREGLNRIISFEEDLLIVGQFKNGEEMLNSLKENIPDVVLLDINMPIKNGLDTLKILKKIYLNIKVVMLTVENDRKTIMEAIDIGADAYILKESAGTEIVRAIRSVYIGEKYIDNSLIKAIFLDIKKSNNNMIKNKETENLESLTNRELSILYEISKGLKNKEIADKLFLSEKTVKNYITSIFKKIEVDDRVQATIYAIRNNIEEFYENKL